MTTYDPITNVMPVASMVTGAAVSAALCDQIRDNLVALRSGWWFRATRVTGTQTTTAATFTPIEFDTLVMSDTATADGSITLVGGSVQTTKPGLWLVGGHAQVSTTTTTLASAIYSTDDPVSYKADQINDTGSNKTDSCCSALLEVTSPTNVFELAVYGLLAVTVQNTPRTALWACWQGGEV